MCVSQIQLKFLLKGASKKCQSAKTQELFRCYNSEKIFKLKQIKNYLFNLSVSSSSSLSRLSHPCMSELMDTSARVRKCETDKTHLVTLKIRSSRRARNTLIPKDVPGLMVAHTTSKILPTITCTCTHTQSDPVEYIQGVRQSFEIAGKLVESRSSDQSLFESLTESMEVYH